MLTLADKRTLEAQIAAIREMPPVMPKAESAALSVKDFKPGTHFLLEGKLYKVTAKHRYQEGKNYVWWEFSILCISTGELTFIEWEEDDYLEVCLTERCGVSLRELGIHGDNAKGFVDSEQDIEYDGRTYEYDDDCKARFFRDDQGEGEKVWIVDYECGDSFLTLERWKNEEEDSWEAALSRAIDPAEILIVA